MATGYSGWVGSDDWRTVVEASVVSDGVGSATVRVKCKVQNAYANAMFSATVTCNGQTFTVSGGKRVSGSATIDMGYHDFAVSKSHGSKSVSCSAYARTVNSSLASYNAGATASTSQAVGAVQQHTVRYDPNGGTGAPPAATKYYGEHFYVSKTAPTWEGHAFQGWATSPTGAVAYAPGAEYTADQWGGTVTMYAVWVVTHVRPDVDASLVRVASSGSTTPAPQGAWALLTVAWSASEAVKSIVATADGSAVTLSGGTSGTSGTAMAWFQASTTSTHEATVTVSDSQSSTTASASLSKARRVVDVTRDEGMSVGVPVQRDNGDQAFFAKVLYDNADGTNATITLAESSANFEYLDIFYGKLDGNSGGYAFVRVFKPNGKMVALCQTNYISSVATFQHCFAKLLIDKLGVAFEVNGAYINVGVSSRTITSTNANESGGILVYRIVGYRR